MNFFKSVGKSIGGAGKSVLSGGVKALGAVGAEATSQVRRGANIVSGIATGNTDKIQSNLLAGIQEFGQNAKAFYGGVGQAAAGGLTGGTLGLAKVSSQGNYMGDTRNTMQIEAQKSSDAAKVEQAKADAEAAAAPEKERQSLLNQQYQNQLMKSGKRSYSTLLGGGY
jgi:hypothetical protein